MPDVCALVDGSAELIRLSLQRVLNTIAAPALVRFDGEAQVSDRPPGTAR